MSNFDATELVVWVQKTVGGAINRMIACTNSGVLASDTPGFREKLYLQATQFLTSDTPLDLDVKKECVVQCMQRLESTAQMRGKFSETRVLISTNPYWSGTDSAQNLLRSFSEKNVFSQMLQTEAEQILTSVQHVLNLQEPKTFKEKVSTSRNATPTDGGKAPTA